MLRKSLAILCLLFFVSLSAFASSGPAPVDCAQLLGWMSGGISGQQLSHLLQQRGVAFEIHGGLNDDTAKSLLAAGADAKLIQSLRSERPLISGNNSAANNPNCPAKLATTAQLVHQKSFPQAEKILRSLLTEDSRMPRCISPWHMLANNRKIGTRLSTNTALPRKSIRPFPASTAGWRMCFTSPMTVTMRSPRRALR